VRGTIVLDVVQCEKLEVPLTTADAPDVAAAVMCERREPVVAIASLSMLRVADLAPGVNTLGTLQVEVRDGLGQTTLRAALGARQ
jgi:hypothetical protein